MSGDAVEMTDHAHPPNNGAGQKASGQGHNPQSRKLCLRQAIGMENREMHADDEAESHRGEPQRMPEEISHSLRSSRRSEPVVTMRKIVELVGKEPAGIDYGRNK